MERYTYRLSLLSRLAMHVCLVVELINVSETQVSHPETATRIFYKVKFYESEVKLYETKENPKRRKEVKRE